MKLCRRTAFFSVMLLAVVVAVLQVGCSDDDEKTTQPVLVTLADFEGSWTGAEYTVSDQNVPPIISMDLVAIGGQFLMTSGTDGIFTGEAHIPPPFGAPDTVQFQGRIELASQDSLDLIFDPEIPPLLTSERTAFQLSGNTLTLSNDNTTFDFDGDMVVEPASFEAVMVRN